MRLERARTQIRERGLDAILVSDPYNMQYISGFSGQTGYLYLTEKSQVVFTDGRYTLQAQEEAGDFQVQTISSEKSYPVLLGELMEKDSVRRLGFEDEHMRHGALKRLQEGTGLDSIEWVPLGYGLSLLRSLKNEEEIRRIKQAEHIGDMAFEYILDYLKPGVTELEIAAKLEYFMKTHGAQEKSFDTIVASGPNSAKPHATPGQRKLERGDFVTLDFGCRYQDYCSDMTRTVVIGKASDDQKRIYETVLAAQQRALAGLGAGISGRQADYLARQVIEEAGYGPYFSHSLGHSLGLEIHEKPTLSPGDETLLEAGMLVTVEPGIYVPGVGGVRIEDLVVISEKGCINLTGSPKELMEL